MKRILLSILVIAGIGSAMVAGTRAFFSDTETSLNNTLTAGTIDISVDGQNPWSRTTPFIINDLKPGQTEYSNFQIQNVGGNPANVSKTVANVVTDEVSINEPECSAYVGTWSGSQCTDGTPKNDIDTAIDYDLLVKVYDEFNNELQYQTIYNKDKTVFEIKDTEMFLGMIPAGGHMDVTESYHMKDTTGDWAQSDKMTFDIVLNAEQLIGTLVLEDKTGDPDWRIKWETIPMATLTYGVRDSKFNYSLTGIVPTVSANYSLIMYEEQYSFPSGTGWGRPVIILGSAMSDGTGNIAIPATSVEINTNLLNAKIWLVKTADLSGNTLNSWNGSEYLFETGLVDYYDTGL